MMKKGSKKGGKLEMVKDPATGKMVPAYAVDGMGAGDLGKNVDAVTKGKKAGSISKPELAKKKSGPTQAEDPTLTKEMIKRAKTKTPAKKMQSGGPVPPKKKGYAKGGKVRGAGIARKGTRPCKMR